uniref:ER lumen protein-retaining receptor n=1 Tax=Romanomermis culicivorax TaxID=13658 RepID=A0A915HM97_ROMCU
MHLEGISGRTQILFALVYITRYVDLFTNFISVYNSVMKAVFIIASIGTVFLIFYKFKATYDKNHDTFRIEFLVVPCVVLALVINHDFSWMEYFSHQNYGRFMTTKSLAIGLENPGGVFVQQQAMARGAEKIDILWTFSIYLESVAILPQLFLLSKTGEAETITSHYLFALGSYRALYIFNWIYRYYMESFFDPIAVVAGAVQTILYADFFYLYATREVQRFLILTNIGSGSSIFRITIPVLKFRNRTVPVPIQSKDIDIYRRRIHFRMSEPKNFTALRAVEIKDIKSKVTFFRRTCQGAQGLRRSKAIFWSGGSSIEIERSTNTIARLKADDQIANKETLGEIFCVFYLQK